ncbi:MAG: flagellar export protein FliJ [Magnetococcales bacterium]|nr:flagellar export protein FliJ [Magnetococcales bacterium]
MNRFSRLVNLRRIREEATGQLFSQAAARVEELVRERRRLEEGIREARSQALDSLGQGEARLPPQLVEDFFSGQALRLQRVEEARRKAEKRREEALQVWKGARIELKQAEILEEKQGAREVAERQRQELMKLDEVGVQQYRRRLQEE